MEQYINVVTNANGSYTIIDPIDNLQQIRLIEGQCVQLVVEDNNIIGQQNLTYATAPATTEQTIFSQPAINLGTHITGAPLDQRQVYIIKTNDSPIQPTTIYTKTETSNKGNWLNESIEVVMKKEASPVKNVVSNSVRNQQQISTTQIPAPNVVIQSGSEKKPTRLVPLNKRHSVAGAGPVGILRNTLQTGGTNLQAVKLGKMKRASNTTNNPNITLPARTRLSAGGVSTSQLTTSPRGPQARPPIHQDAAQRNSVSGAKGAQAAVFPEMTTLSERIKQANLKQRQQNNERIQRQQPVMAVTPTPRPVQSAQTPTQRQRAMGQLLGTNRQQQQQQQQQQLQLQQQQQQLLLHQQQQQLQQQQQHLLQRQQIAAAHSRQVQVSTTTEDIEQPMEVDSDNLVQLERLNQLNCTAKSDPEENSSESVAYLQQEIDDPHTAIVQHQITGNEAKMLVILENGEQRLITFEVPKEDCTVQDLLEQANIFSTQEPQVSLVSDPTLGINYIVDVTSSRSVIHEEENVECMSNETANVISTVEPKTPVTSQPVIPQPTVSPKVPKYIEGMLAVCPFCGMSADDFNYCMRCKRKLPENVKAIPISSGVLPKKENAVPVDVFYKTNEAALTHKTERDVVAKRGRGRGGRGRGLVRTRQVKEPECLTISSDEEDDSRKQKRITNSKEASASQSIVQAEECDTILEKEPVIAINSVQTNEGVLDHLKNPAISDLNTNLTCRTVRVGSYKYVPRNDIFISASGLKLEVPLLEDENSFITVDIKCTDLVAILIHFSKSMPVLFFYPNVATGLRIRDILGMQDPKGPYFDPASRDHTHKRITLLPDKILDESRIILKELFKPIIQELSVKEANDILLRASPKTPSQSQPTGVKTRSTTTNSTNSNGAIQTITVYPAPPAKGGIAINTEDYLCLAEDQFLNDVIIDFYLKYLTLEILSPNDHQRTHVFSSYFYKRLTSPHTQGVENSETLSAAGRRHARVQKWTKNVNIFEKDFVVIPINEHAHWFLAIICFPGLVGKVSPKVETKTQNQKLLDKKKKDEKSQGVTIGSTSITPVSTITLDTADDGSERDEAEGDDEEMDTDSDEDNESESKGNTDQTDNTNCQLTQNKEVVKVPCILIFDSLTGASRNRVVATLRDYLSCEYQAKMGAKKIFTKDTIKGACPKVPQQSNFTDCGLYVLQYVESFFQTPILDYTLPIKTLKNWFEEIIVTRKREELANLLKKLVNNTKGDKISLPTLTFPTQDGVLKQKTETKATETETKKKSDVVENKLNVATSTTTQSEEPESTSETPTKVVITQLSIPISSNQSISTTDGSLVVQKEAASTTARSPADTMTFLKNKRIPRLQKSSENQEDKQVAKKHKGDSFDSCK